MGFKGGFSAFTDGFLRSMQAGDDRKRLEQERADAKERQLKEDSYRDEQRAREKKNLEEADALRAGLKASAQPVPVQSVQSVKVEPGQDPQKIAEAMSFGEYSVPGSPLKQSYQVADQEYAGREEAAKAARTEQLRNIATFKANNGDPSALIQLEDGLEQRKELAIEKAKKMAQEGVIQTAHASITGSPEAVFSAYNSTGKKRMLEKPQVSKRVINGMNTYDYTAKVQHEDGTVTNERFNSHELNLATVPYAQLLTYELNAGKSRLAAARGIGGGSRSSASPQSELQPNTGTTQNKDKVYERWIKHFTDKSQRDSEVDPKKAMTPAQIYQSAQLAAQNEIGYNQSLQEEAMQKQAISTVLRGHLDRKDYASYARDYDKLINLGSKGFTTSQLADLGFLEVDQYRKDAAVDARTIGLK